MGWRPPWCPNPDCPNHDPHEVQKQRRREEKQCFHRIGTHKTKSVGSVERYRCTQCGKSCSRRTFSTNYYTQRQVSLQEVEQLVCSCTSIRAMSRKLHCSRSVVANRIMRLSRQMLALQGEMQEGHELQESLVIDGFISYVQDKYHMTSLNLIVGSRSCLLYGFTVTQLRRGGRMSESQKRKAERIRRTEAIPSMLDEDSFRLWGMQIDALTEGVRDRVTVHSDEHKGYPPMLEQLHRPVIHETTNSREPRTVHNPLFPVNYMDRELRKDLSEHVRKTCCEARSVQAQCERLVVYQYHHNHRKAYRINAPADQRHITHADMAGVRPEVSRRLSRTRLGHRIPFSHCREQLSWFGRILYLGLLPTAGRVAWTAVPKFIREG